MRTSSNRIKPRSHPNQRTARFRRPLPPRPIEPFEIQHPALPEDLDGLRVLQIADLHIRRPLAERSTLGELLQALPHTSVGLALLNGDFMHHPGHEDVAIDVLERIVNTLDAPLGTFGVFGNHDSGNFIQRAKRLPGIRWLLNDSVELRPGLRLAGASYPEDFASAVEGAEASGEFILGLCHYPNELIAASELGMHVILAGHTHGGQIRLGKRLSPHTSCDLPWHQASGLLRYRNTLCFISRGLGEAVFEQRICCPRHAPLITLRRGPLAGPPDASTDQVRRVAVW